MQDLLNSLPDTSLACGLADGLGGGLLLGLPPDPVDQIHHGLKPNSIFESRTSAPNRGPGEYEVNGYVA